MTSPTMVHPGKNCILYESNGCLFCRLCGNGSSIIRTKSPNNNPHSNNPPSNNPSTNNSKTNNPPSNNSKTNNPINDKGKEELYE